jgi:N-methylhydantoinase B
MTVQLDDPIVFEVLRHRIEEIVHEAYYTQARCSGNAIITEAGDHQEALLDSEGNTVMVSGGIVEWTYALEAAGKHLVETYEDNPGIYDGDQFVLNDSYIAAVHHMDIQVLAPVFYRGKRVAWMVTAGHTMDVGGIDPGGYMLRATEVAQEGLRLPGIKLIERGIVRKDIEHTLKGMTRQPDLFMLDISARVAANNSSSQRLKETIDSYGLDTVLTVFKELQEYSETLARAKLKKIPDGDYKTVHYIESISEEEKYLRLELTARKEGDELVLDFTGSSPESQGSQNITKHGTISCALCSYLTVLAYDIPYSAGVWRPIKWNLPEGTIINPKFPRAVSTNVPLGVGSQVAIASLTVMSRMALCSEELKKDSYSGTGGGLHSAVIDGFDKNSEYFVTENMECEICGQGAQPHKDGEEACIYQWTPQSQVANVESTEELFPILYLWRKEAIDTGGAGKFRGGVTNTIGFIPWDADFIRIQDLGLGQEIRTTNGLHGGYPAPNTFHVVISDSDIFEQFKTGCLPTDIDEIHGNRELKPLFSVFRLFPKDVLIQYQSGGGGFGDPVDRDPLLVARDVKHGYVSIESAKEIYGVIIDTATLVVDMSATKKCRNGILESRLRSGAI